MTRGGAPSRSTSRSIEPRSVAPATPRSSGTSARAVAPSAPTRSRNRLESSQARTGASNSRPPTVALGLAPLVGRRSTRAGSGRRRLAPRPRLGSRPHPRRLGVRVVFVPLMRRQRANAVAEIEHALHLEAVGAFLVGGDRGVGEGAVGDRRRAGAAAARAALAERRRLAGSRARRGQLGGALAARAG